MEGQREKMARTGGEGGKKWTNEKKEVREEENNKKVGKMKDVK